MSHLKYDPDMLTLTLGSYRMVANDGATHKMYKAKSPSEIVLDPHKSTVKGDRARAAIEKALQKKFDHIKIDISAKFAGVAHKVRKADDPKIPKSDLESILDDDAFWISLWASLPPELAPELEEAVKAGQAEGIIQANVNITEQGLINSFNQTAHDWAEARAAEMVGMRNVDGKLVPNPNAEWVISDTTREELRRIITHAFEDDITMEKLIAEIKAAGTFSDARSEMIARTEVARAQVLGNVHTWEQLGLVHKVRWQTTTLLIPCDECYDNSLEKEVTFGDEFPSGDLYPPAHPNCRCVLVAVEVSNKEKLELLGHGSEAVGDDNPDEQK